MMKVVILILAMFAWPSLQGAVTIGWQATFETKFHNVSGTVAILDFNTLSFENFSFDGGGPAVYFFLTEDLADVESGFILGDLLSGTSFSGEDFTIDLGPGRSLADFSAISVWCEAVGVDFGSGEFVAPIPEPSSGLQFALLGTAALFYRRGRCR